MRIALDVEQVLADSHSATFERAPDLTMPEESKCWDFPTDEEHDRFMHVSHNVWHNHWEDIPRMDLFLNTSTQMLTDFGHRVDIVTGRHNVDDQVQAWLDRHSVVYEDFITSWKKHELDYDVYIDDNPGLARALDGDAFMFLRDQPYNRDINEHERDNVYRIRHLRHAAFLLVNEPFLTDTLK